MKPSSGFAVRRDVVAALVAGHEQAATLEDAFPAPLLAAVWGALIDAGAIATPDGARLEVRPIGSERIELTVALADGEVRSVVVRVTGPGASAADPGARVRYAARALAEALALARPVATYEVDLDAGSGQKPHG